MITVYHIRGSASEDKEAMDEYGYRIQTVQERGWKKCTDCKEQLSLDRFTKDKTGTGGLSSRCRDCEKIRDRVKYSTRDLTKKGLIRYIKNQPCTRCLLPWPAYTMQFDHLPEYPKKFEISRYKAASVFELIQELKKCQLVCANCHTIITHERKHESEDLEPIKLTEEAKHYISTSLSGIMKNPIEGDLPDYV